MGRFDGFKAGKTDSLVKRAASALIWLRSQTRGATTFVGWVELYSTLTGVPMESVDPTEVKDRLRSKGYYIKAFLRELGYGWCYHPSDRGMIRATNKGDDSALNYEPHLRRLAQRASENYVDGVTKTVGDTKKIKRTSENGAALDGIDRVLPKHRAIMASLGMVPAAQGRAAKKAA